MKVFDFNMRFHTPAFLGDAEQNGAWRTPAIKALLRQFWRMEYARRGNWVVDVARMREEEGILFGRAGDRDHSSQSRLRLRLDRWDQGQLTQWPRGTDVQHPEVPRPVDALLYLGYGPIVMPRNSRTAQLKKSAAIQANESARLKIAVPDDAADALAAAIAMAARFGTLGGRSRNGWGSFVLAPTEGGTSSASGPVPLRSWEEALHLDWPHALGKDDRGALLWETGTKDDWRAVMTALAELKIRFRTQFRFAQGNVREPESRHWLAYPVTTNHSVGSWSGHNISGRIPNSLRFKVVHAPEGGLKGLVFHIPCRPPTPYQPNHEVLKQAWAKVHAILDEKLTRGRLEAQA